MHQKLIEKVLASLDGEPAAYFSNIAEKVAKDPRTDASPNLVYLVLKETIPFLPTYLPIEEFLFLLFSFVRDNKRQLNQVIFDKSFIEHPDNIRRLTNVFVGQVLQQILEKYDDGKIDSQEPTVHNISWPLTEHDFPYIDDDDEDDDLFS